MPTELGDWVIMRVKTTKTFSPPITIASRDFSEGLKRHVYSLVRTIKEPGLSHYSPTPTPTPPSPPPPPPPLQLCVQMTYCPNPNHGNYTIMGGYNGKDPIFSADMSTIEVIYGDFTSSTGRRRGVVGSIVSHKDFDKDTGKNDIAIIRLSQPVPSMNVIPLCSRSYKDLLIAVCGMGSTIGGQEIVAESLQEVKLQVMSKLLFFGPCLITGPTKLLQTLRNYYPPIIIALRFWVTGGTAVESPTRLEGLH